jgi:hypothetical protein
MSASWTEKNRLMGIASSIATLLISIAYVIVTIGWIMLSTEPFLIGLEVVSVLSGLILILLISSVYHYSPAESKLTSLIALLFTTCFGALTITNHLTYLTVLRTTTGQTSILGSVFSLTQWPSIILGVDYVAWGLFLGLGLIFNSSTFRGSLVQKVLRFAFLICGFLCILGFIGLALGGQSYWFIAVAGYGIGFFIISILLTKVFLDSTVSS